MAQPLIGLIAGAGELPAHFIQRARQKGYSVATVAVRGSASPSLLKSSHAFQWISLGQLGALISFFQKQKIRRIVMHGKVEHSALFKNLRMDWRALRAWLKLKDRSGEALLKALAGELKAAGIQVLDSRTFMEDILATKGWLTRRRGNSEDQKAAAYGLKQARALARLRIGQTVVVKGLAVAAVEAMEGTDETIRRAGKWAGPGSLVVKVASPRQDWRFDTPTIGPLTLRGLREAKVRGLVVEAGRSFILQKEETLALADKNGIFILGV